MVNGWSVSESNSSYRLQGRGIDGVLDVTTVSLDYMKFPDVVKWCSDRNSVPVSPKECFANRIAQDGLNDTDKTQFTRCAVLYTIVDGKFVALFDDIAVPDENVVLKYFGGGVADHGFGDFVLPKNNSVVRNTIDRALAGNGVLSLEGRTENYTTHSLDSDVDGCEYERVLTPIVGSEVAEGNVKFLKRRNKIIDGRREKYAVGGIWLLTPKELKEQGLLTTETVIAHMLRVGGVDYTISNLDNLNAVNYFNLFDGRACGAAYKKS